MIIKLGQIVECIVSGFNGTVIQTIEQLNGNTQYGIQPRQKEGETTYPDAMFLDPHMLKVTDAVGITERVTEAVKTDIKIGQKVRDKATGMEGIAVEKATYINGCASFGVMPERRSTDLLNCNPDKAWISVERLIVIGDGLLPKIDTPKTTEVKVTPRPPGGPARKMTNRY